MRINVKAYKHLFKYIMYFITVIVLFFLDHFTNYLSHIKLKNKAPFEVISDIIELRYL